MKLIFKTNLDAYKQVSWPILDVVPRKGEIVYVVPGSREYCDYKKIPPRLEVCRVEYHHDHVLCELWYNEIDYKLWTPEHLSKVY